MFARKPTYGMFIWTQYTCFGGKWGKIFKEASPKGFSASKCDEGNWILSKSKKSFEKFFGNFLFRRIFLKEFIWRNCLGEIFWEDFLGGFYGGIYLEDCFGEICFGEDFLGMIFFGGILWEEFFERNYLVEINKELMFLSRFCL